MSRTGRWLLVGRGDDVDLVDLQGAMPRRTVPPLDGPVEIVGRHLWGADGNALVRIEPGDLRTLPTRTILAGRPNRIVAGIGAESTDAWLAGSPPCRVTFQGEAPRVDHIDDLLEGEDIVAAHASRLYVARGDMIRAIDRTRTGPWKAARLDGEVVAACVLFGGRVLAVWTRRQSDDAISVLHNNGHRIHQVAVDRVHRWAVAEERGHAFLLGDDQALTQVDLRYGRVVARGRSPIAVSELAVDQDGRQAVLARIDDHELVYVSTAELMRPSYSV